MDNKEYEYELTKRIIQKAMAYDLIKIIENAADKNTYTAKEVIGLIHDYISAESAK